MESHGILFLNLCGNPEFVCKYYLWDIKGTYTVCLSSSLHIINQKPMINNIQYIFTQEIFYLQHILNDISELDTSFLDKGRVLHRLLAMEFYGFTSKIDF